MRALLALVGNALAGAASGAQRRVRVENATFMQRVGRHSGAARALRAIGFTLNEGEDEWVLPHSVAELHLAAVHAVLTAKYDALDAVAYGSRTGDTVVEAQAALDSALGALAEDAGDPAAHGVALSMLAIIAANAAAAVDASSAEASAAHAKYRRLRRSNAAFERKVGSVRGAAGVLRAIGFVRDGEDDEQWTAWTLTADASPTWLAHARAALASAAAVARAVSLAASPPAKFAPYIASLPAEYPTCVDLWSAEEVALCDDDEMTARGAAMRSQRESCRADLRALAAEFPAQFELISNVGEAEFAWAWHSVTTRAFSIPSRWVIDRFFRSEGGGHFSFTAEPVASAAPGESSEEEEASESESSGVVDGDLGHWWDAAAEPAASASTLSERDLINRVVAGRRSMSVLVPILDLLNHCPGAPTTLTLDGDDVVVIAQRAHGAGSEACIDYGKGLGLSRFQLLHTFGFVPWQSMTHDGDCVAFRCASFLAAPGKRYTATVLARAGAALGNSQVRLMRGAVGSAMQSLRLFRLVALTLKGKAEGVPHAALDAPQPRPVELLAVHLAKSTLLAFLASKACTLEEDCAALTALRSAGAARAASAGEAAAVAHARRELALAYRIGVHVVVREQLRFLALVLSVVKAAFAGGAKAKSPALSAAQLDAALCAAESATTGRGTAIGDISDADKAEAVAYITQWRK